MGPRHLVQLLVFLCGCCSSSLAIKPEDKITCFQWQEYLQTHNSGQQVIANSATLGACLDNCANFNGKIAPADTITNRCLAVEFEPSSGSTGKCWHLIGTKEDSRRALGTFPAHNLYMGSTAPLCPPYMEDNLKISGCNITSMNGYMPFAAQATETRSGVNSNEACAALCINSASCTFYAWSGTNCYLYDVAAATAPADAKVHFGRTEGAQTGFIGGCENLYGSCGFKVTANTQATGHSRVTAATTFDSCVSNCESRASACYGFDWDESNSACYHYAKELATPTQAASGVEHYDRFCGCNLSENNSTNPCATPSASYISAYDSSCRQLEEWYQRRYTSGGIQANTIRGIPETHDLSVEECISLMYTGSYAAIYYNTKTPYPYWRGHRCFLYPTIAGLTVVTVAQYASLTGDYQYRPIGTSCPSFTTVATPAESNSGSSTVCSVKQWPSSTWGLARTAHTTVAVADAAACLSACVTNGDCYGSEYYPSNSFCYMYGYISANMYVSNTEVFIAPTIRYSLDRNSCCGS